MDLTYIFAGFLSGLIGLIAAIVFVIARGRSIRRLYGVSVVGAVVADFALLVNWNATSEISASFLATDLLVFSVYALIGCLVGVAPVLGIRALFRLLKKQGYFQ